MLVVLLSSRMWLTCFFLNTASLNVPVTLDFRATNIRADAGCFPFLGGWNVHDHQQRFDPLQPDVTNDLPTRETLAREMPSYFRSHKVLISF